MSVVIGEASQGCFRLAPAQTDPRGKGLGGGGGGGGITSGNWRLEKGRCCRHRIVRKFI